MLVLCHQGFQLLLHSFAMHLDGVYDNETTCSIHSLTRINQAILLAICLAWYVVGGYVLAYDR